MHTHNSVVHGAVVTVTVLLGFTLLRVGALHAVQSDRPLIKHMGKAILFQTGSPSPRR